MRNSVSNTITKILAVVVVLAGAALFVYNTFFVKEKNDVVLEQSVRTKVHFIDVGQGDAILITSGNEAMLVDTGSRDNSDKVVDYIKQNNIEELKCLLLTHQHVDHIGEAADVIEQMPVDKIIMPKVPAKLVPTNSTYKKFLQSLKDNGKKVTAAQDGEFMLGDATIQLFTSKKQHTDLNNYSVIVKVTDGESSFLLMGDAEVEEEKELLASKMDLSADVLKVGHHGGNTSTSGALLKAVDPEYAVISCARDNDYGHPDKATLGRIKKFTDNCYITYKKGDIVFTVNGSKLSVSKN